MRNKIVDFEVHASHIPLWERKDWRYAILMGGRGNGRSGTAARFATSEILSKEYTRGAMMRATREDIRASCWGTITDIVNEQGVEKDFRIVDNDMYIERGRNSLRGHGFRASSGSLTARLKSLADYNFIWGEEFEEVGETEFRTLDDSLRTTKGRIRILLSLNTPSKNHWLIQKWFDLEPHPEAKGFYIPRLKPEFASEVLYLPGTFRENLPNLDANTVRRYEAYKFSKPAYYWQMIEGLSPETVLGKIYNNWKEVSEIPFGARLVARGLDFGWFPDPAACVDIYYYNGGYIFDEVFYQVEMRNSDIATALKNQPKQQLVVADSAEPKSIAEIQGYGITIIPCAKGADSVAYGIGVLQSYDISYTKRSVHLKKEYENYAWKTDKDGEIIPGTPKGGDDHCLDAARYGMTSIAPEITRRDMIAQMPQLESKPRKNPAR